MMEEGVSRAGQCRDALRHGLMRRHYGQGEVNLLRQITYRLNSPH